MANSNATLNDQLEQFRRDRRNESWKRQQEAYQRTLDGLPEGADYYPGTRTRLTPGQRDRHTGKGRTSRGTNIGPMSMPKGMSAIGSRTHFFLSFPSSTGRTTMPRLKRPGRK